MKYLTQTDVWRLDNIMKAKPITEHGQSRILGRFRQIFPLTLFPDELIIEELRIVWVKKNGPWMNEIVSIMATDIACVNSSSGPFFGHIHVQSLTGGPEILVDALTRGTVLTARSLIEGIALSAREGLRIVQNNIESERASLLRAGEVKTSLI